MFKSRDFTKKRLKIPKGNPNRILKNRKHNGEKKKIQKDKQRSTNIHITLKFA